LGIVSAQAAVIKGEEIVALEAIPYKNLPRQAANEVMEKALKEAGLSSNQIDFCISTGHGKRAVPHADDFVHEMGCLQRAVQEINPRIRTVIDVGGHTLQAFAINEKGGISENISLHRCVTGTGLYLEVIARALGMSLEDILEASLTSEKPLTATSQCVVLAESEVISLVNEGNDPKDIFAGVVRFAAVRIGSMARKVRIRKEVAFVGGMAKNAAIRNHLEESLEVAFAGLAGIDPQAVSAYGAALIAKDKHVSIQTKELHEQ
jgi:predicted CoA-substrate-specific enzyme activase